NEADAAAGALSPGRVFNSNAVAVAGLLRAVGCEVEYRGLVRDVPDQMREAFQTLLGRYDVVLSTGGVSVGRYDAVHRTWLDLGVERGGPMAEVRRRGAAGDLAAPPGANALVLVPPGTPPLPPGSRVAALALDRDEDRDRLAVTPACPGPMVVGVIGESGGGKTTVLVDLVRRLAVDGIRAVAVKHAADGFDSDRQGSDSAR